MLDSVQVMCNSYRQTGKQQRSYWYAYSATCGVVSEQYHSVTVAVNTWTLRLTTESGMRVDVISLFRQQLSDVIQ